VIKEIFLNNIPLRNDMQGRLIDCREFDHGFSLPTISFGDSSKGRITLEGAAHEKPRASPLSSIEARTSGLINTRIEHVTLNE
jgi:hypothetical protein